MNPKLPKSHVIIITLPHSCLDVIPIFSLICHLCVDIAHHPNPSLDEHVCTWLIPNHKDKHILLPSNLVYIPK